MPVETAAAWLAEILFIVISAYVFLSSLRERQPRAAFIGGGLFAAGAAGWAVMILAFPGDHLALVIALFAASVILAALLFYPIGRKYRPPGPPTERMDERLVMFARNLYSPDDGRYEDFYTEFPELKGIDDSLRAMPDLGEPGGISFDPFNSKLMNAQFDWIERIRKTAQGSVAPGKVDIGPEDAAVRLKGLALHLGAVSAGTTAVDPGHVYSRIGRGIGEWGSEIDPGQHPYAIVFAVEMAEEMIAASPLQPVVVESSSQYVEAAKIALVIAEYIRLLGYPARAHIDGNYRVILPQLAANAGLGEVGRLSLLITPQYGPRVRLGAVTTTLPLPQAEPISFGVQDFCGICLKCARNCPSGALPMGEKEEVRGTAYWRMKPEKCYRYWRKVGTDCGICIAVCPYSHPRGLMHSIVRAACRRSAISRRLFSAAEDLFYGREPRSTRYPPWMLAGIDGEIRRRLRLR